MDLSDLRQLKDLLEKLEQLESVEKLQKENDELKEYKRRYLAIKGIVEWNLIPQEPIAEKEVRQEPETEKSSYGLVNTNGRSYGETIRNERKLRHLTLDEVSKKCDIARNTIYEIENNIPRNNAKSKIKLENFYGIRIEKTERCEKDDEYMNNIDVSKIRETRKLKKLTLRELAEITGVPASTIHEIENDKLIKMNIVKVNKIKKALGLL